MKDDIWYFQNEEKKMELWLTGQADIYTLEAKSKKQKEDFAAELRDFELKLN